VVGHRIKARRNKASASNEAAARYIKREWEYKDKLAKKGKTKKRNGKINLKNRAL
jgi:hypothetical protein